MRFMVIPLHQLADSGADLPAGWSSGAKSHPELMKVWSGAGEDSIKMSSPRSWEGRARMGSASLRGRGHQVVGISAPP